MQEDSVDKVELVDKVQLVDNELQLAKDDRARKSQEIIKSYKLVLRNFFQKLQISFVVFFFVSCLLMGILFSKVDNVISQLKNQQSADVIFYQQNEEASSNQNKVLERLQIIGDRQAAFYNRALPKEKQIVIHDPIVIHDRLIPSRVFKFPFSNSALNQATSPAPVVVHKNLSSEKLKPCHVAYNFFIKNRISIPPCAYVTPEPTKKRHHIWDF